MHDAEGARGGAAAAMRDSATLFPPQTRWGSLWGTVVDVGNMLKAFIGLNFMYVAFAFSKAGLIRGAVGLALLVFITEHCCLLLVNVKNTMPGVRAGGKVTFADIARHVGGRKMEAAINFALVITQFGYCVGYLIFISQTVHDLLKSQHAVWPYILVPLPPLVVLAMLKSIRSLGPWSLIANCALLVGFMAVVAYIAKHFQFQPASPSLLTFPLFFGQMTAALEGIGIVVPVETSMANPARFPLVLRLALLVMTCVLMTVGVLGFATFGAETRSIILLNFGDSPVVNAVKCVLVVGILFTYPLQLIPVIQATEEWLFAGELATEAAAASAAERATREAHLAGVNEALSSEALDTDDDDFPAREEDASLVYATGKSASLPSPDRSESSAPLFDGGAGPPAATPPAASASAPSGVPRYAPPGVPPEEGQFVHDPRRVLARLTIVLATAATAMLAGASFGLFQSLVGSVGASSLAYTAPALFHVRVFGDRMTPLQKAKDYSIFVFGVLGTLLGTGTAVWEIIKVHTSESNLSP